ncbi:GL25346 [Drosophila persimilis]|uniref:GL25346 n=1 Tax=Drosophila persimilis TaxID=7234 RepID=B4HDE5_DROPE|nr:GL25346 [Drosophila persimilis]
MTYFLSREAVSFGLGDLWIRRLPWPSSLHPTLFSLPLQSVRRRYLIHPPSNQTLNQYVVVLSKHYRGVFETGRVLLQPDSSSRTEAHPLQDPNLTSHRQPSSSSQDFDYGNQGRGYAVY